MNKPEREHRTFFLGLIQKLGIGRSRLLCQKVSIADVTPLRKAEWATAAVAFELKIKWSLVATHLVCTLRAPLKHTKAEGNLRQESSFASEAARYHSEVQWAPTQSHRFKLFTARVLSCTTKSARWSTPTLHCKISTGSLAHKKYWARRLSSRAHQIVAP